MEADGNELANIADLLAAGRVKPHIGKTYSLEEASEALAAVEQGHSVGKIVLIVS